jgi:HK97 family phage prohead protease
MTDNIFPSTVLENLATELGLTKEQIVNQYRNTDGQEIVIKEAPAIKNGKMLFSGYASTITADLSDEIVLPESFDKFLWRYKRNPIICFQHDRNQVVGNARNVEIIQNKGLWMDMELAPIPFVKEYLWILLEQEYIKQMSIGFLSLKGSVKDNYYVHEETYLLENSVVTVACNPDAEIGVQKLLTNVKSLEDFEKNKSDIEKYLHKRYFNIDVDYNNDMKMQNDSTTQTVTGIFPTSISEKYAIATDTSKFLEIKNITEALREDIKEKLYLGKKINADGSVKYLWNFASIDSETNQLVVDFNKFAISSAYAMGAKGDPYGQITKENKIGIIKNICSIYNSLEKELPHISINDKEHMSIGMLEDSAYENLSYSSLVFKNSEDVIFTGKIMQDAFVVLNNTPHKKDLKVDFSKYLMATINIWGQVENEDDLEKLHEMLMTLLDIEEEEMPEEDPMANPMIDPMVDPEVEEDGMYNKPKKPMSAYKEEDDIEEKAANPYVPTQSVRNNCRRGIEKYEAGLGGDGLESATIREARSMAAGEQQTEAKIRKGNRWWGRNERFLDEPNDSPAMVAALLWGGASGRDWFRRAYNALENENSIDEVEETIVEKAEYNSIFKIIID